VFRKEGASRNEHRDELRAQRADRFDLFADSEMGVEWSDRALTPRARARALLVNWVE
jgi:hypothetical protein